MGEQPNLWEQNDLLSMLSASPPAGQLAPKAAATPEPPPQPGLEAKPSPEPEQESEPEPDPEPVPPSEPETRPAPQPEAGPEAEPEAGPEAVPAEAVPTPQPEREPIGAEALPSFATPAKATPGPGTPNTLLILDTETTGLNPQSGQCIEVGAILFHVGHRAVLSQVSFLIACDHNPAEAINGIPAEVTRLDQPWTAGLACFEALLNSSDAVLAHNVAFDRQWFGQLDRPLPAIHKPWICSMEDIPWPAERHLKPTPSVRDLALAYEVPVWAAHRALTDCIYLAEVLRRCDDLEALLSAAQQPRSLFRAQLSYAERHRAKHAGFRWNDPVAGAWSRRLSQSEAEALPFPVQLVSQEPATR